MKKKNTLARLALRALNCKAEWESNIGFELGRLCDVQERSPLSYRFSMTCWARSGFQVVEVQPKLAAQYALTEFPGELPVDIEWPWQSFLVTCSDPTLGFSSVRVNTDMQAAGLPGWASLIIEPVDGTQSQWVAQGPLSEMLKLGLGEEVAERVRTIAARIALSAALLLTDPAQLSQARKLRNRGHRRGIVKKKAQRWVIDPRRETLRSCRVGLGGLT